MMTYELIGAPRIETEYSDEWEAVMVCDVRRSDGETGDVWVVAGVPDYQRGSSAAAGTVSGYADVRVFGDSPDMWCPESFRVSRDPNCQTGDGITEEYSQIADGVVDACRAAALAKWREYRAAELVA